MGDGYLIGFDIGGGGGRCLLVDVASGRTHVAGRAWRPQATPGTAGLGFDFDTEMIFARLADACRDLLQLHDVDPARVLGVATSAMREGTVVVADDGEILLATPNCDARAAGEGLELAAERGESIYTRTGRWPFPIFPAVRLLWMKNSQPERFARARHVLSLGDWLTWRLCGEAAYEVAQAGETLVLDLATRQWADDLIDDLGLPRELFPAAADAGTRLAGLRPDAAAALGLTAGTPIAVGGADSQCALLGAGVVEPGQLGITTGTTAPVQLVTAGPTSDPARRLWPGLHVIADRWVLESNAGPLGDTIEWMASILFTDSRRPIERFFAEAATSTPGAHGMLSTLGVKVWNAAHLDLAMGDLTMTHMLTIDDAKPRRHVARAIIEGLAFGLRANLAQIETVAGTVDAPIRLSGGVARSQQWAQLVSDVFARPVELSLTPETSALGAAICAGRGAGVFSSLAEGAERLAMVGRTLEPDAGAAETLADVYEGWERRRCAAQDALETASALATPWVLQANDASASPAPSSDLPCPRILVTADMDEVSLARLATLGDVEYASFRGRMRLLTGPSLVEALEDVDVFITEVDLVDAAALAKLPDLRVVATCRSDAVNVSVDACTAYGVPVLHAPGRNAVAVADLAVAFVLMLARKLPAASRFLHAAGGEEGDMGRMGQAFGTFRGGELWNRTVGLVGLGAVGRKVARRLGAFGARVLVADPYLTTDQAALVDAELVSLDRLLGDADIVSLHAAVTPETTGMIGAAELARMKPGALLVNTARAALVDEAALIESLQTGRLGGAALDVFRVEPPAADHPLLQLDSVVATPHLAGNTEEVAIHQGRIIAEELECMLAGQRPRHALNPQALDGFDWHEPRKQIDAAALERLAAQPAPAVSDLQKSTPTRADGNGQNPADTGHAPTVTTTGTADADVRDHMQRIGEAFVAGIVADSAIAGFAADADVTLHFQMADLGLDLHFTLDHGRVSGAVGAPAAPAEVQLKMAADMFDGMFTGRSNAMEAAMDGRLSFTGDTAKAMTLQQLQRDLQRIYTVAREDVGDPGDLTGLASADGAAPTPMVRRDRADEIIEIVNELYSSELITATGGNVSARTKAGGEELWITPSQLFKGELTPEVLVRIDLDGQPLDAGTRAPSSERLMHTAVYRARPEAEAVIHCHAPHATILANTDLPFLPISTEAAFFGDIPRIPFIMPGTGELADAIGEAIGSGWAVLMKNHGLLVAGRSLRRAADMAEVIERSAEIMLGCYAVGKEPPVLPEDVVTRLRRMGDLVA